MNLFLLLTAMLSALAGIGRSPAERVPAAIATSRLVSVAQAVAPVADRQMAERPDGYVAPLPLSLDLRMALDAAPRIVPERRRE